MTPNFQRDNSTSNASAGKRFESLVLAFFNNSHNLGLISNIKVDIGISSSVVKKPKIFDLGKNGEILIECKSHSWRGGGEVPQAKLTTWNEAMYIFHLVPKGYRKLFVVEKYFSDKWQKTLAQYYLITYCHFIPDDVEIWEFDCAYSVGVRLK